MIYGNTPLQSYSDSELSGQNFQDIWKRVKTSEYNVGKFKNHIIGGDFTTNPWQRGTSFVSPATASYTADRWRVDYVTTGTVTITKTADAPTIEQTGGYYTAHCLHVDVTGTDAAVAAGDYLTVTQRIEGLNASHFGFGQSPGAKFVSVSFWVKTDLVGCYGLSLRNSARNRCYPAIFYVEQADTWEYKSIKIPVDNTGTWLYDTGIGVEVSFSLMAGTTFQRADASCQTWDADNLFAPASQVNLLASASYNFKLALVQLTEAHNVVSFEWHDYTTELMLCQRYYEIADGANVTEIWSGDVTSGGTYYEEVRYATPKRVAATIVLTDGANSGFAAGTPTYVSGGIAGFRCNKVANATVAGGYFAFGWTASSEL